MYLSNILKDYGTHKKLLVYKHPFNAQPPTCKVHYAVSCQICYPRTRCKVVDCELCLSKEPSDVSITRTKTTITDYVLCNDFEYFCTFTFDPTKVDSFNVVNAKKSMSNWLNNQRKTSPLLKYLIVAEKHKSGRIHFHALFKNYEGILTDSGRLKNARRILNISGWKHGYSTAIKIDNIAAVGFYMQKYITKDMIKTTNKKRYWASKNLQKPQKIYNIPNSKPIRKILNLDIAYISDEFTIYNSFKN